MPPRSVRFGVRSRKLIKFSLASHWMGVEWVTKNLLSRAPPCFGRHVKPLVPAAFAVVNTHQPALGPLHTYSHDESTVLYISVLKFCMKKFVFFS
jgi:hypothetical protein